MSDGRRDAFRNPDGANAAGLKHGHVRETHTLKRKIIRSLTSLLPVSKTRVGECNNCGDCCALPKPCMFLRFREDETSYCSIYSVRPPTCRKYPRVESEFITPERCGYSFVDQLPSEPVFAMDTSGEVETQSDVESPSYLSRFIDRAFR